MPPFLAACLQPPSCGNGFSAIHNRPFETKGSSTARNSPAVLTPRTIPPPLAFSKCSRQLVCPSHRDAICANQGWRMHSASNGRLHRSENTSGTSWPSRTRCKTPISACGERHGRKPISLSRDAASRERLMGLRPCLSPHAEMGVLHRVRDGQLVPEVFSLRCNRPFEAECILQPWLAQIASRCDGQTSWREHFEKAKGGGMVSGETTAGEFLAVLEPLVSNGLLWIAEKPFPQEGG